MDLATSGAAALEGAALHRKPNDKLAGRVFFVQSSAMVKRSQILAFSNAVARQFRPRKIVLFGSYAYGQPTEGSDVDLLVIMPRTRHRGERMSVHILQTIPRDFPLDLLVRTRPMWPSGSAGKTLSCASWWKRVRSCMKPTTREWVKKAENDFRAASQLLRRRKDVVPDAVCFFGQQCVEKYSRRAGV